MKAMSTAMSVSEKRRGALVSGSDCEELGTGSEAKICKGKTGLKSVSVREKGESASITRTVDVESDASVDTKSVSSGNGGRSGATSFNGERSLMSGSVTAESGPASAQRETEEAYASEYVRAGSCSRSGSKSVPEEPAGW